MEFRDNLLLEDIKYLSPDGAWCIEQWSDIKLFEKLYCISNLGRIKSLVKKWQPNTIILKVKPHSSGYSAVTLCKEGRHFDYLVHVLVATYFVENPHNLPEVNHIWGNKKFNPFWNLEWTTRKGNSRHSFANGLNKNIGETHAMTSLSNEDVLFIYNSDLPIKHLSEKYNVSYACIYSIKNGSTWRHLTGRIFAKTKRLLEDEVVFIYTSSLPQKELADMYSIRPCTVSQIKSGLIWPKITSKLKTIIKQLH